MKWKNSLKNQWFCQHDQDLRMKWINVDEKLPDYGIQVLVYRSNCNFCIDDPESPFHIHTSSTIVEFAVSTYNQKQPEVARYFAVRDNRTYYHLYEDHWEIKHVRFWMPLPLSPGESKGLGNEMD